MNPNLNNLNNSLKIFLLLKLKSYKKIFKHQKLIKKLFQNVLNRIILTFLYDFRQKNKRLKNLLCQMFRSQKKNRSRTICHSDQTQSN